MTQSKCSGCGQLVNHLQPNGEGELVCDHCLCKGMTTDQWIQWLRDLASGPPREEAEDEVEYRVVWDGEPVREGDPSC
jgi:hypothetical protein